MPKRKQAPVAEPEAAASEEEEQASQPTSSEEGFPSEASSSDESGDDEDGAAFDNIAVDFEFFNPQEADFHGLKALLHTYLEGRQYSCSELVEAVIGGAVGTVIKCGEDDDAIGVVAVLNLATHAHLACLGEIKAFLMERSPDDACRARLEAAWAAAGTALVVSERLLNCPPQLAAPLMEGLFEEVAQAGGDYAGLQRYILVSRAYVDPLVALAGAAGKQTKKGGKKKGKQEEEQLVHATPDGEFLSKHAAWRFSFPIPERPVGKDDLEPRRHVALVEAAAVPAALAELQRVMAQG